MRRVLLAAAAICVLPIWRLSAQDVRLFGYLQPRFESVGDSALFKLRRARLGAQGGLTPWARFRVQAELRSGGDTAKASVQAIDLWIAVAKGRWSATFGQLKTPFAREFLLSSTVLELSERPLVVDALAPNRDVGAMVEWHVQRIVIAQAGVFNGDGINRASNSDKRLLYIARVVLAPGGGLELGGAAATYGDSSRWNVEAALRRGPLSARAEFLRQEYDFSAGRAEGWYAFAAYFVRPERVQLAARLERYDPTRAAADRRTGYTAGGQYLLRGDDLKLQVDYAIFEEEGPAVDVNRLVVQMQVRF
ncbi:MAG: porin [Gemmatimonadales bacterium]